MNELKPCPFCGGKAELICVPGYFKTGLSSSGWLVKCLNGCVNQMPYSSDHEAVEAWNRREEPERPRGEWIPHKSIFGGLGEKVYTCNQCGYNIGFHTENFCPNCGAKMEG